jgi:geranylgeranyl transferase type-2 subunit alpha
VLIPDAVEFDLVKNALYTDPADQSAWLYHRWLIGAGTDAVVLEREIGDIQALLNEQPDSKCMWNRYPYSTLH